MHSILLSLSLSMFAVAQALTSHVTCVVELLDTDNDDRMAIIHNTLIVHDFCRT